MALGLIRALAHTQRIFIMGSKVDSYVDGYGNIIKDGDIVIYEGSEYKVIYIKSPVKITTVTKKEIVPGEYGCVKISLLDGIFVYDLKTTEKTKLLNTIKTLQEIYDCQWG